MKNNFAYLTSAWLESIKWENKLSGNFILYSIIAIYASASGNFPILSDIGNFLVILLAFFLIGIWPQQIPKQSQLKKKLMEWYWW